MNISYAVPVCNEIREIKILLSFLMEVKAENDEIVVLFDQGHGTKEVEEYLESLSDEINLHKGFLEDDFSKWKNLLSSKCSKEYILQLDADEMVDDVFIETIKNDILLNPECEMFLIPRLNFLLGSTNKSLEKIDFTKDQFGRIRWPDYQTRLYKNLPHIYWENKVHESLRGYRSLIAISDNMRTYILHIKTIENELCHRQVYKKMGEDF